MKTPSAGRPAPRPLRLGGEEGVPEEIRALRSRLEDSDCPEALASHRLAVLAARVPRDEARTAEPDPTVEPEEIINPKEAAARLGRSTSWL